MVHALKTEPEFFEAVRTGKKKFEVRENDRGFAVGDYLALNEITDTRDDYTGQALIVRVSFILDDKRFCKEGFITMGIVPCLVADEENGMCERPKFELCGGYEE